MTGNRKDHKWLLAVGTAVTLPILFLHSTCIAVMGPGTWGSGLVEMLPDLRAPTAAAERYRAEFGASRPENEPPDGQVAVPPGSGIAGRVIWTRESSGRTLYLAEDERERLPRQRLYLAEAGMVRESRLPDGHVVVRPQWIGDQIVYERWNPWAIAPSAKLRRYLASWLDPSLRPEASLYRSDQGTAEWLYLFPGHSLTVAPDGRRAALLRSGALLAGYYSVHVWRTDASDAPAVISLRESAGQATRSFSLSWSRDSSALRIFGRTGGFDRRASRQGSPEGAAFDLLYLVSDRTVYDLNRGI